MATYSVFMEDEKAEETAQNGVAGEPETPEAEYVFEGFEVEFSEKIALTPPATTAKGQAAA
jgi:hypothetical protein